MTEFEKKVFDAVKTIPYGEVATYGDIARMIGNPHAARAVGNALHKNDDSNNVPCFRVIHSDGRLSEAFVFGGVNVQKSMLEAEGHTIIDDRVVRDVTALGNPRKPTGEAGEIMLSRMNESHFEVTGWALSFSPTLDAARVLDIGCGGGETLARMSKLVQHGHLVGVDYSQTSVGMSTRKNAADIKAGKMEILCASVERLPLPDDSFDFIITVESFYFWPSPVKNLREVLRVLKPGGTFLLVADIYNNGKLGIREFENIKKYKLTNPTEKEFSDILKKAKFSEISIHTKEGTNWICVEGHKSN